MASATQPHVKSKVVKFEAFINDVLKEDLKDLHFKWERKNGELAEWVQLKTMIQSFLDMEMKSFKSKMDIGTNVFAQVYVPDTSNIIVNVGAGVHVEYSLLEALTVVNNRIKMAEKELDVIKDASCAVKARIKLVLHGIQELENIK